jgi:threonine dehydratase
MEPSILANNIGRAQKALSEHLPITPLSEAFGLSEQLCRTIFCKWDNKLCTGSFKERGALYFLLGLNAEARKRGVCAASAGNHALAVSFHAQRLGIPCYLVMPEAAPLVKVERCRRYGADITQIGTLQECLLHAEALSQSKGYTFIPPFNHERIITGQGVAGLEVLEQCADFDSVVIPVGGGGYAAGVATAIKAARPDVFIMGVCSEWALSMRDKSADSYAGKIAPVSIADGIAVKSIGSITAPILDKYVNEIVSVSEESIARAIVTVLEHEHVVLEGAGAAGIAALLQGALPERFTKTVVFCCGSNIDSNVLSRLIEHDMAERGRLLRLRVSLPDKPGMLHTLTGIISDEGANVLEVVHNRTYAKVPGYVEISVVMEVRGCSHADTVIGKLEAHGLSVETF